jgi:heme o synthase
VLADNSVQIEKPSLKISDYIAFTKLRLSLLVLFSAGLGYLITGAPFNGTTFTCLLIGGFCITAASNGLNQIFERELDKLMKRTMARPLPKEKMSVIEAYVLVVVFAVTGTLFLWFGTNPLCTILSVSSLILYAFAYTPMKRVSSIAVFVGAIPGALPPLLGYVAAKGEIDYLAILLFTTQFMWQFPHFWAIAWRVNDDYAKAGFSLLPFKSGHSKQNAFQILIYTFFLIPVSLMPVFMGYTNLISGIIIGITGFAFLIPAVKLYRDLSMKSASALMFSSFLYLPVVQIFMWLNI